MTPPPSEPVEQTPPRITSPSHYQIALLLVAAVIACFYPLSSSEFLNWDEQTLLVFNTKYQGFSGESLGWIFSTFFYGHYQPLAWLSFAFDFALWGSSAPGFRWTSIALHALNVLVFYRVTLLLLTSRGRRESGALRWAAAFGASFFAVHPLRVEPVAWLANRNGLLATLFVLLALAVYLGRRRHGAGARVPRLLLALLCYALALFSKASVITFPAVLLILDVYPLRRIERGVSRSRVALVLAEKLAFVAVSAPFAALALLAKREAGGLGEVAAHGWIERMVQGAYGLGFYLWKTVLPVGLSPLYLLGEQIDPAQGRFVFGVVALIALLVLLLFVRRRAPWLVAAWLCYATLLLPVLGLTQAGAQLVADRYAYLSCLPWAVLFAAFVRLCLEPTASFESRPRLRRATIACVGLALIGLGVLCHRQVRFWQDPIRFWSRVLEIEPESRYAFQNRGRSHQLRGDLASAIADYDRVLQLDPMQVRAYRGRGIAKRESGDLIGALADLEQTARLSPAQPQSWIDLGVTRRAAGEFEQSVADFSRAILLRPGQVRAHHLRALSLEATGDTERAMSDLDRAIALDPEAHRLYASRGRLRESRGDLANAALDYERALELAPVDWRQRNEIEARLRLLNPAGE